MTNKEGSSLDEAFDTVCNVGCAPRLTVGLTADYTDDQPNKAIYIYKQTRPWGSGYLCQG